MLSSRIRSASFTARASTSISCTRVTDLEELEARSRAAEVILRARDEGLCRFVGITGHNLTAPEAHLEAMRRYDLDTVMFPVNPRLWADTTTAVQRRHCSKRRVERNVGVMAIKAAAARPWGERTHTSDTWYEPYVVRRDLGPQHPVRAVGAGGPCAVHTGRSRSAACGVPLSRCRNAYG